MRAFDAVLLAGGRSTRMGRDKTTLRLGDRSLLQVAIDAVDDASTCTVVGPRREVGRDVLWAHEDPPGSGPVAAIASGLGVGREGLVVILACDMPYLDAGFVTGLVSGVGNLDGCVPIDSEGRRQWLAGAYRRSRLATALSGSRPRSMEELVGGFSLATLVSDVARDVDTPEEAVRLGLSLSPGDLGRVRGPLQSDHRDASYQWARSE